MYNEACVMGKNKIKTKKTLLKRVKISKRGKILKKQVGTSHLRSKWDTSKRHRKTNLDEVSSTGYVQKFKKLLGIHSKGI